MLLASSYLTPTQFRAMPSDYDLTGYTDPQLQSILNACAGQADAMMRRSYRAQEQTVRYIGDGRPYLELEERPLLYVKRVAFALPGAAQTSTYPPSQLLIDYEAGRLAIFTPLYFQGVLGYAFPRGVPIDVTEAWGAGYTVAKAPAIVTADVSGGGLVAGTYNLAFTAKTSYGETTASVSQVTTATGSFTITPTVGLGVYVYRAYLSSALHNTTLTNSPAAAASSFTCASIAGMSANAQWLLGSGATAEIVTIASASVLAVTTAAPLTFAHTSGEAFIPVPLLVGETPIAPYVSSPIQMTINSTAAPTNIYQDSLPVVDTSAPAFPDELIEANRLLAMSRIFEQNNLSNRGIGQVGEGTEKIIWRSTEGNSGRGKPLMTAQAEDLLAGLALNALYFG